MTCWSDAHHSSQVGFGTIAGLSLTLPSMDGRNQRNTDHMSGESSAMERGKNSPLPHGLIVFGELLRDVVGVEQVDDKQVGGGGHGGSILDLNSDYHLKYQRHY